MSSAFFYGTLMHPKILKRVIQNDGGHLTICPAILVDHTRHQVKHADYPGVVPYARSRLLFDKELAEDERSVRGTLVVGLTQADMHWLDIFEGNEYVRTAVSVHPLAPLTPLPTDMVTQAENELVPKSAPPLPPTLELKDTVRTQTYIWSAPITHLTETLWSYETFIQESAWKWVGEGASDNEDYKEVDRRREMAGDIVYDRE